MWFIDGWSSTMHAINEYEVLLCSHLRFFYVYDLLNQKLKVKSSPEYTDYQNARYHQSTYTYVL